MLIALWTRVRPGITLLSTRRTQHHPLSAASKHPVDAGPSWGPQSMMRHLAGLRWQSQRRRRRPSGQRRPSTKPSRGRAWVTHTAPKQPSLPSAEDERAAWGPPPAAAARTMPMLRNAFQPNVTLLCTYTVRMSLWSVDTADQLYIRSTRASVLTYRHHTSVESSATSY